MTSRRSLRGMVVHNISGDGAVVRLIGAAMIVATLAVQHPGKLFKRLPHRNMLGVFPYWGFFAPTPSTHDLHVMVRFVLSDDSALEWHDIDFIEERRISHAVWFPEARQKKALYDLVADMLTVQERGADLMARSPAFAVLTAHLRARLPAPARADVTGFQFAIVESAGYDDSEAPRVKIVSRPQPLAVRSTGARSGPAGE